MRSPLTKIERSAFARWLGRRSYVARLERLGLRRIQAIARENGKEGGRPAEAEEGYAMLFRQTYRDRATGKPRRSKFWSYEFTFRGSRIRETTGLTSKTAARDVE